ncbi:MAG: hypothetical protein V2I32_00450 [Desulforhopalus sp.]|jgi:hypothetical protein|nr:hypothetical protein [Desulforhopalus sp.]
MAKDKLHFFDKPGNIQLVLYALYGCCAVLFILDFIIHRHKVHPWEGLLGFYAVYGFVGCVVLVLVAKWMRTFLMRDEEYYDRDELQEVEDQQGGNHVGH